MYEYKGQAILRQPTEYFGSQLHQYSWSTCNWNSSATIFCQDVNYVERGKKQGWYFFHTKFVTNAAFSILFTLHAISRKNALVIFPPSCDLRVRTL